MLAAEGFADAVFGEERAAGLQGLRVNAAVFGKQAAAKLHADTGQQLLADLRFAVFAQGVGHFVADDGGEFVVCEVQFFDEAAVHRHFAARHRPGVEFVGADDVHFPVKRHAGAVVGVGRRHHAVEDVMHALGGLRAVVECVFALCFAEDLLVALGGFLVEGLAVVAGHVGDVGAATERQQGQAKQGFLSHGDFSSSEWAGAAIFPQFTAPIFLTSH